MKVLLAYFSATGNTKLVVNEIKEVFLDYDFHVDVGKISHSSYFPFMDYDMIGIASPVMSWKPTYVVMDFVKDMPRLPGKLGFAVVVHGGMGANAHHILARRLKAKKIKVLDDLEVEGENSFIPTRQKAMLPYLKTRSVENSMADVRWFARNIASKANAVLRGEKVRQPLFLLKPHPMHYLGKGSSRTALRRLTGNKHVKRERCTKCGFCAENCPVGAIALNPYPQFDKSCFGCWSCINNCPEEAIVTFTAFGGLRFPGLHRPGVMDDPAA